MMEWLTLGACLVAEIVRNLPAMQMWFRSLGQEDPLQKEMATHSSILAWETPRTEEPGRLQPVVLPRVRYGWTSNATSTASLVYRLIHIRESPDIFKIIIQVY